MKYDTLAFLSCTKEDASCEILSSHLKNGYLIEHEEEISTLEDGSKAIRYILVKHEQTLDR